MSRFTPEDYEKAEIALLRYNERKSGYPKPVLEVVKVVLGAIDNEVIDCTELPKERSAVKKWFG